MNFRKDDFDKALSLIKLGAGLATAADGKNSAYMPMEKQPETEEGRSFLKNAGKGHLRQGMTDLKTLSII